MRVSGSDHKVAELAVRALAPYVEVTVELHTQFNMELLSGTEAPPGSLGPWALPPFMAGSIASGRMLNGLLAHAFVDGNTVRLVENLVSFDVGARPDCCRPFSMPVGDFVGHPFGLAFQRLSGSGMLPLALLRVSSTNVRYVVTSPYPATVLVDSDSFLVLARKQPGPEPHPHNSAARMDSILAVRRPRPPPTPDSPHVEVFLSPSVLVSPPEHTPHTDHAAAAAAPSMPGHLSLPVHMDGQMVPGALDAGDDTRSDAGSDVQHPGADDHGETRAPAGL
jgi:hypothetical protein